MISNESIEDALRRLAPRVLATLARRYGHFDACEDAVQESLLAAALQWPSAGVPADPRGWLLTVATRRLVDEWRSEGARRRREERIQDPDNGSEVSDTDDTLTLLFLCCHPALSAPSQLALTLRAVGGLTTAEIASAFLMPEATVGQRISRAKSTLRAANARFESPSEADRPARLGVVLHVLYLIFNEGYTSSGGAALYRTDLTSEAIRLTRLLLQLLPDDCEVAGLLALMLLTDARRPARTLADGSLVPLSEQERSKWNRAQIEEGTAILGRTLGRGPVGPYQLQASIAAIHDEALSDAETDWEQILTLYSVLEQLSPGPVVTLNTAVAVARVHGPLAGLSMLGKLEADERMDHSHRVQAVRAHLLEMAGEMLAAREAYLQAARRTASEPEQRYLAERAAKLAHADG